MKTTPIIQVEGARVSVLGAGKSGLAVAALLAKKGAKVTLSDAAAIDGESPAIRFLTTLGIEIESGGHSEKIYEVDFIVTSPGIPIQSPVLQAAIDRGIPVYGELEAASWFNRARILAVTGSNGKSTTTSLLGAMCRETGLPTVVAGNIGTPFSSLVDETRPGGFAVLEVSSFQLETIHSFRPEVALFLNLTPDHLDRHGSFEAYGKTKARIFENQTPTDWLIVNGADRWVLSLTEGAKGGKGRFGWAPSEPPCGYKDGGHLMLRFPDHEEILVSEKDMVIQGPHNVLNALAASLAARLVDIPVEAIRRVLCTFSGLPHRLEYVRTYRGVIWINDSKATNVDSVWYALGSFSQPIVWIAGGRDKDSDFTRLSERVQERVKTVILMGEASEKMANALKGIRPIRFARSLDEAVLLAAEEAREGEVVLLSPACASFDMFRNYEDRGDQFKERVRRL